MPKGYWIVRVSVHDASNYPRYLEAAQPAFAKYGARFLVRGGKYAATEGQARERNVVVEFADYDTAVACYESPEYVDARQLRQQFAQADFLIAEGA